MKDKDEKKKAVEGIVKLARELMGEKLSKKKPMAVEVEVTTAAPKSRRSKDELKKALGI